MSEAAAPGDLVLKREVQRLINSMVAPSAITDTFRRREWSAHKLLTWLNKYADRIKREWYVKGYDAGQKAAAEGVFYTPTENQVRTDGN
jgi:predicted transcriptional regulator